MRNLVGKVKNIFEININFWGERERRVEGKEKTGKEGKLKEFVKVKNVVLEKEGGIIRNWGGGGKLG